MLQKLVMQLIRIPATLVIALVRIYQKLISPLLPPTCRFQPTCSAYTIQAITKYGLIKGAAMGIGRIARCNPWCAGGEDPP